MSSIPAELFSSTIHSFFPILPNFYIRVFLIRSLTEAHLYLLCESKKWISGCDFCPHVFKPVGGPHRLGSLGLCSHFFWVGSHQRNHMWGKIFSFMQVRSFNPINYSVCGHWSNCSCCNLKRQNQMKKSWLQHLRSPSYEDCSTSALLHINAIQDFPFFPSPAIVLFTKPPKTQ